VGWRGAGRIDVQKTGSVVFNPSGHVERGRVGCWARLM